MQYETIILELMTRIKSLETEVAALKETVAEHRALLLAQSTPEEEEPAEEPAEAPAATYRKMTPEMIDICYLYGKQVHEGGNSSELADEVVQRTGMNRNTVVMYLYAVNAMLSGTVFKRAISSKAIHVYFDRIHREFGSTGLQKAVESARLHAIYRRECGIPSDAIERLCDEYGEPS